MSEKQADSTPKEEQAGEQDALEEALSHALDGAEQSMWTDAEPEPKEGQEQAAEGEDDGAKSEDQAAEGAEGEEQPANAGDSDESGAEPGTDEGKESEIEIPEDFPAEHREALGRLPDEAKKVFLENWKNLRGGYTRKEQELSELSKTGREIESVFEPYKDQLRQMGKSPGQAVSELVNLHQFAQRDPKGYIKYAAQGLGVDLKTLVNPEAGGEGDDAQPDPSASLMQYIGSLEQQIRQMPQVVQDQLHSQEIEGRIEAFRAATDESGQPKYPHFDRLRPQMAMLVQSDPDKYGKLEDAYDAALYLDPEIRTQVLTEREKAAAEAVKAKQKEEVEKAKKAGRNPTGRRTPARTDYSDASLDDVLNETISEYGS